MARIPHLSVFADSSLAGVRFAATDLLLAQRETGGGASEHHLGTFSTGSAPAFAVVVSADAGESARIAGEAGVKPMAEGGGQRYSLRRKQADGKTAVYVLAGDAAGAMYGMLDVAEAVRLGTLDSLPDSDEKPYLEKRGIKFNIPLDARTPSYSDNSDAVQANIAEMWSFDFWSAFLDDMARHRYNVLTLWSLHPFPSIVTVPEYPEVALDHVMRSRREMNETYTHSGSDMVREETLASLEVLRTMPIAEKIAFWRRVMEYARDREIEVYWFTWNIFTFGATGKHGITPQQDNPATIAYFRASVRELVLTYPLLAGIGITSGEQMQNRDDEFAKEKWLWATYGLGILDAKKIAPERKVRLIHRYHQTSQTEILNEWKEYPDTFELSFKYSIAHMYSIPNPPFIHDALAALPEGRRLWLTVRNDDVYSFRWGNVDYARAYVKAIPQPERIAGYYMGPDGYCWGRENLAKNPEKPRELVIRKQWFSFLLWGRLTYNPDIPNDHFTRILAVRFPEVDAGELTRTWAHASSVFPLITRFFWGDIDLRWFPEACLSHPRVHGFYTVRHFAEWVTMPGSGVINLRQWRANVLDGQVMEGVTPPEIANALADSAADALFGVDAMRGKAKPDSELACTLADIEAMAFLARYYSAKIRAACELVLFDKNEDPRRKENALRLLEEAAHRWEDYAAAYTAQYEQPKLYNRVGFVDIPGFAKYVHEDMEIARNWKAGTIPDDTSNQRGGDRPFRK